jgi:hypothetical protein
VGPILDLAVIALSVIVCASLALLAWTLGVTGVAAIRGERARVEALRERLPVVERAVPEHHGGVDKVVVQLSRRFRGDRLPPSDPTDRLRARTSARTALLGTAAPCRRATIGWRARGCSSSPVCSC